MHSFMASVLLRLARVDPLELDPEARPPSREFREPGCRRDRREWLAVVRTNRLGQPVLREQLDEDLLDVLGRGLDERGAREQIARCRVHDGQRVTEPTVARLELALEVDAPDVVGLAARVERASTGS